MARQWLENGEERGFLLKIASEVSFKLNYSRFATPSPESLHNYCGRTHAPNADSPAPAPCTLESNLNSYEWLMMLISCNNPRHAMHGPNTQSVCCLSEDKHCRKKREKKAEGIGVAGESSEE